LSSTKSAVPPASFSSPSRSLCAGFGAALPRGRYSVTQVPAAEFARNGDAAAGLMSEAVDLRQTQAAAFVRAFGGEEWIEHQGKNVGSDTGTVIGDA
jgi:hypothetical protein